MLDLSNNNAIEENFVVAYHQGGQRRIYLKRCEGTGFIDGRFALWKPQASAAGFEVGEYDFLHPLQASPADAADYLIDLTALPLKPGRDLRLCLDCEEGSSSPAVGAWITAVAALVTKATGVHPLIYGSGYWLEACQFPAAPGPLWLAAYGRNDGRQYPVGRLPSPWKILTAHQYTSNATVPGISGGCDLSVVAIPQNIDVPRPL